MRQKVSINGNLVEFMQPWYGIFIKLILEMRQNVSVIYEILEVLFNQQITIKIWEIHISKQAHFIAQ